MSIWVRSRCTFCGWASVLQDYRLCPQCGGEMVSVEPPDFNDEEQDEQEREEEERAG
jgi:hypothetical protein